jgi:transcription antitermination factor NusA-like protein
MKSPICNVCLAKEVLCKKCLSKNLSKEALEILRFLYALSKRAKSLENIEILDVMNYGDSIILVAGKGDGKKIVGRKGNIVKKLSSIIAKEVRVIEKSHDFEKMAENLLLPARISRINTLFLPEREVKKIFIPAESKPLMPYSEKEFKEIVKKTLEKDVEIIYE